MRVDDSGRLVGVQFIESPNADDRPPGCGVDLLVIHNISLPPNVFGGDDVLRLFTNSLDPSAHPFFATIAGLRVSAHFWIRRSGAIVQFVPCVRRAWHAGESSWRGRPRCNDFSVGIELEGADSLPYSNAQYQALAALVAALRHRFPGAELAGHADIAPGRKTDPGPAFDWQRLRALLAPPTP